MADQRQRRNLDDGFGGGNATDRGSSDAFGEKPRHEFIGKAAKLVDANRPGDDHIGDPVTPCAAPYDRILGVFRQRVHGIDRRLKFVQRARHVPAGFEFQSDLGLAFARRRVA